MTQNNITDIEKCSRLMGCEKVDDIGFIRIEPDGSRGTWLNPRTNKADLMDVEIELNLDVMNSMKGDDNNYISVYYEGDHGVKLIHEKYADHPTKFAARAEAVMSVVSQLYDAKYGKDE